MGRVGLPLPPAAGPAADRAVACQLAAPASAAVIGPADPALPAVSAHQPAPASVLTGAATCLLLLAAAAGGQQAQQSRPAAAAAAAWGGAAGNRRLGPVGDGAAARVPAVPQPRQMSAYLSAGLLLVVAWGAGWAAAGPAAGVGTACAAAAAAPPRQLPHPPAAAAQAALLPCEPAACPAGAWEGAASVAAAAQPAHHPLAQGAVPQQGRRQQCGRWAGANRGRGVPELLTCARCHHHTAWITPTDVGGCKQRVHVGKAQGLLLRTAHTAYRRSHLMSAVAAAMWMQSMLDRRAPRTPGGSCSCSCSLTMPP